MVTVFIMNLTFYFTSFNLLLLYFQSSSGGLHCTPTHTDSLNNNNNNNKYKRVIITFLYICGVTAFIFALAGTDMVSQFFLWKACCRLLAAGYRLQALPYTLEVHFMKTKHENWFPQRPPPQRPARHEKNCLHFKPKNASI